MLLRQYSTVCCNDTKNGMYRANEAFIPHMSAFILEVVPLP